MEDWYKIKPEDIKKIGGGSLLSSCFNNSLPVALQSTFPEHKWLLWQFKQRITPYFWNNQQNQIDFIQWLSKQLHVRELKDWYRISLEQIQRITPIGAFQSAGGFSMLSVVYPDHPWDMILFKERKAPFKSTQRAVTGIVQSIFPNLGTLLLNLA